jgi:hypothetical protein
LALISSPTDETGFRMCTTRQSLAPERWGEFFDGLVATDGPSLVAVEVVRKRPAEQRIGMPRTLSQIGYDLDRDVLRLTSGALDENDAGVLRHFIHEPLTISVEDRAPHGPLLILVCDATGVRTRIRLHARACTRTQADLRRASCRAAGRTRRRPCSSHLLTTTSSATARRACRQGTSA